MVLSINSLFYIIGPLFIGWLLDMQLGDPSKLPHPIVGFGKLIAFGDHKLNQGNNKKIKGGLYSLFLIVICFVLTYLVIQSSKLISPYLTMGITTIGVFFCLAGKTLQDEVLKVFTAVEESTEKGRKQLSRIVGRDTSQLSPQAIRTAALETLAENLSDGVIAPLFWFAVLGLPGMLTYKLINTMDSMIAYKNKKYKDYGCWAAHIDDFVNYIPARITAFLMLATSNKLNLWGFVRKYHKNHLSPNSGYPESAMAGILDCQFGGPNIYQGKLVEKAYIGETNRELTAKDVEKAIQVNSRTEKIAIVIILIIYSLL